MNKMIAQWEDEENNRQVQFSVDYTVENARSPARRRPQVNFLTGCLHQVLGQIDRIADIKTVQSRTKQW